MASFTATDRKSFEEKIRAELDQRGIKTTLEMGSVEKMYHEQIEAVYQRISVMM
jgi:hypothetical protein